MGNSKSFSTFLIFMPLKTLKGNRYDELDVPGRFCHKTKRAAKQNSARYIMRGENQIKILTKLSTSHGARCLFWHQWKSTTVGDNNVTIMCHNDELSSTMSWVQRSVELNDELSLTLSWIQRWVELVVYSQIQGFFFILFAENM